jgi:hypothetical protein
VRYFCQFRTNAQSKQKFAQSSNPSAPELGNLDFLRTGPCFQLSKISDLNKGNSEGKTLQFSTEFIRIKSYVNDESTGGMPLRSMLCVDK